MTFETQEDFETYVSSPDLFTDEKPGVCFGFSITDNSPPTDPYSDVNVQLYFNDQTLMGGPTSVGIPNQQNAAWSPAGTTPKLTQFEMYTQRGYDFMENTISNILLQQITNDPKASIDMMVIPMQSNDAIVDNFNQVLGGLFPFLVVIMYIPIIYNIIFMIVQEKESKTKESMRMMGMSDLSYWLSWFVYYLIIMTIANTLALFVMMVNIIEYSKAGYIWIMLWLYGIAVFGLIVSVQSIFNKKKFAGIGATMIYFIGLFINFPVQDSTASSSSKLAASIMP